IVVITQRGACKRMKLASLTKSKRARRGQKLLRELKTQPHHIVGMIALYNQEKMWVKTDMENHIDIVAHGVPVSDPNSNGSLKLDPEEEREIVLVEKDLTYETPFTQDHHIELYIKKPTVIIILSVFSCSLLFFTIIIKIVCDIFFYIFHDLLFHFFRYALFVLVLYIIFHFGKYFCFHFLFDIIIDFISNFIIKFSSIITCHSNKFNIFFLNRCCVTFRWAYMQWTIIFVIVLLQ